MSSPQRTSGATPTRMPGLDGLRTVAILLVLAVHAQLLPGGFIGVDLFFVLSGFLITTLMLGEIDRTGRLDLVGFWLRRAFRLLPAMIVFLLAGIGVAALTKPAVVGRTVGDAVQILLGVFNYTYPFFGGGTAWDGHLWSLNVEAQFYLVWPLVVVQGLRRLSPRAVLRLGLVAMAVFAVWRAVVGLGALPFPHDWYHVSDTRIDGFVGGAILALVLHHGWLPAPTTRSRRTWQAALWLAWVPILAAAILSPTLAEDPRWAYLGGLTVITVCVVAIVAGTLLMPDHPVSRVLASAPMTYVGRISYAFYLWHYPVVFGLEEKIGGTVGHLGTAIVAFVVTLVLAQLSMTLVERPASRLRAPLERTAPVARLRALPRLNPTVRPQEHHVLV